MTTATVTTQQELDDALSSGAETLYINSPAAVILRIGSSGSATVVASGSATVEAYDSATVEAYDSATVRASGSATVRASGSATVVAYGSATVEASGSATVWASGLATVWAYGLATVWASGLATVWAYGSATVRASGSATVRAYGSATVTAGTHVAVHLHSSRATITGGVVIDVTAIDLNNPASWCGYHGVQVNDDQAVLFKATDAELTTGQNYDRPTVYTPATTVTADDWRDDHECGGGLHVSPRPDQARQYRPDGENTRYLRVAVKLAGLCPIGADKAKAKTVHVLAEVDANGNDLPAATAEEIAR